MKQEKFKVAYFPTETALWNTDGSMLEAHIEHGWGAVGIADARPMADHSGAGHYDGLLDDFRTSELVAAIHRDATTQKRR
jgi:hypothetical protein